jgi:hypothetical protein
MTRFLSPDLARFGPEGVTNGQRDKESCPVVVRQGESRCACSCLMPAPATPPAPTGGRCGEIVALIELRAAHSPSTSSSNLLSVIRLSLNFFESPIHRSAATLSAWMCLVASPTTSSVSRCHPRAVARSRRPPSVSRSLHSRTTRPYWGWSRCALMITVVVEPRRSRTARVSCSSPGSRIVLAQRVTRSDAAALRRTIAVNAHARALISTEAASRAASRDFRSPWNTDHTTMPAVTTPAMSAPIEPSSRICDQASPVCTTATVAVGVRPATVC